MFGKASLAETNPMNHGWGFLIIFVPVVGLSLSFLIKRLLMGRIHFSKNYFENKIVMENGTIFKVFRVSTSGRCCEGSVEAIQAARVFSR